MALYINGQLQTMSSKIRYNESTDMVQIYYQGQWHDWQAGGANIPDGKTVTPINDVTIWQQCAGIANPTYTTLAEVLADTGILSTLMASNNAVDYLARSKTFASDVCADSNAMTYIGQNNYASNTLLADSDWRDAICNSTYFESVLNVKVPTMTSNTTPKGVCSASSTYGGSVAYYAFDGQESYSSPTWTGNGTTNQWVQYEFVNAIKAYKFRIVTHYGGGGSADGVKNYKIQGSNDGFVSDVHDLYVGQNPSSGGTNYVINENIPTPATYKYYRCLIIDTYGIYCSLKELQFYGREDV